MKRFVLAVGFLLWCGSFVGCDDGGKGGESSPDGGEEDTETDSEDTAFIVIDVNPEDEQTGVPIDQTIRVSFSHALDPTSVGPETFSVSANGEEAVGRIVSNRNVLMFVPAQLEPEAEHTVTISGDVRDYSGESLNVETVLSFATGSTAADGTSPLDVGASAPFKEDRFIYLSRRNEYAVLGADYDDTGKNLFVVDPLVFNEAEPLPTDEIMFSKATSQFGDNYDKRAKAANFDDDFNDEVAILIVPDTGPATVGILDSTDGTFTMEILDTDIGIETDLTGVYEYDLDTGDVDLDGYEEIVITARASNSDARMWILDDAKREYALIYSLDILGNLEEETWTKVSSLRAEVGNFVEGKQQEIALLYTVDSLGGGEVFLKVVEGLTAEYDELDTCELESIVGYIGDRQWDATAGDLDGNGLDDLVLATILMQSEAGSCELSSEYSFLINNGDGEIVEYLGGVEYWAPGAVSCSQNILPDFTLRSLDIDGDMRAEILLHGKLFELDASEPELPVLLEMENYVDFHSFGGGQAPV